MLVSFKQWVCSCVVPFSIAHVEKGDWALFKVRWKPKGNHKLFRPTWSTSHLPFYVATMSLIGVCKDRPRNSFSLWEEIVSLQRILSIHVHAADLLQREGSTSGWSEMSFIPLRDKMFPLMFTAFFFLITKNRTRQVLESLWPISTWYLYTVLILCACVSLHIIVCRGCTCIWRSEYSLGYLSSGCHSPTVLLFIGGVVDGVCVVLFFEIGSLHWPETCWFG